jgi:hypothetical protein
LCLPDTETENSYLRRKQYHNTKPRDKNFKNLFIYWISLMKNLDSDTLLGERARGSTHSMLGYGLCKLVAGETASCECRHLQTSPLFKIHIF